MCAHPSVRAVLGVYDEGEKIAKRVWPLRSLCTRRPEGQRHVPVGAPDRLLPLLGIPDSFLETRPRGSNTLHVAKCRLENTRIGDRELFPEHRCIDMHQF